MTLQARLQGVNRLFLDTAPIIYFVEKNPRYLSLMELVFERIDDGALTVVTSPITLAECLVLPLRQGSAAVVDLFTRTIVAGPSCEFVPIDQQIAHRSAQVRAEHNLLLPDALQIAVALTSGCDAFLTNDPAIKRVADLDVLVLEDLM